MTLAVSPCGAARPKRLADLESNSSPSKVEPSNVEPSKVEPSNVEPSKVDPSNVEPSNVEPSNVEPSNVEPSNVEPLAAYVENLPVPRPALIWLRRIAAQSLNPNSLLVKIG